MQGSPSKGTPSDSSNFTVGSPSPVKIPLDSNHDGSPASSPARSSAQRARRGGASTRASRASPPKLPDFMAGRPRQIVFGLSSMASAEPEAMQAEPSMLLSSRTQRSGQQHATGLASPDNVRPSESAVEETCTLRGAGLMVCAEQQCEDGMRTNGLPGDKPETLPADEITQHPARAAERGATGSLATDVSKQALHADADATPTANSDLQQPARIEERGSVDNLAADGEEGAVDADDGAMPPADDDKVQSMQGGERATAESLAADADGFVLHLEEDVPPLAGDGGEESGHGEARAEEEAYHVQELAKAEEQGHGQRQHADHVHPVQLQSEPRQQDAAHFDAHNESKVTNEPEQPIRVQSSADSDETSLHAQSPQRSMQAAKDDASAKQIAPDKMQGGGPQVGTAALPMSVHNAAGDGKGEIATPLSVAASVSSPLSGFREFLTPG